MGQKIKSLLTPVIISMLLALSTITYAQGDGGNDPDFPDVPLDGGMSILLAAGAAYYTHRKLKNSKKEKDSEK